MSGFRPKRKATANKSYNDTLEEFNEEEGRVGVPTPVVSKKKVFKKIDLPKGESKITIPYNWQSIPKPEDYFSNKLDLTDAYIDLDKQTLVCPNYENELRDDKKLLKNGFYLTKGDYIYMISEPPGEPYYVGRIMGFTKKKDGVSEGGIVDASNYMFQIQWFYRPRDISKSTTDSRLLFASMHTDTCPFVSYRGLITVRHKQDIENEYNRLKQADSKKLAKKTNPLNSSTALETYSLQPNCFYFDKLFDRYMIKFYEILSTHDLLQYADSASSKSKSFLLALNKRFEFIFVESQRTKGLISSFGSSSRNCEKCELWCDSPQDTINCVVCHKYYHMYCLDPPLLKKPSRGFSWACALCTKEQELVYQSKRIVMLSHDNKSSNEKELTTEISALSSPTKDDTFSIASANQSTSSSQDEAEADVEDEESQRLPMYEIMAAEFLKNDANLSLQQRRLKEEWPMRYLGMHSRLEDGIDLDDRNPYPRASTRLGAKHQATNIPECNDHPIVYYDVEKGNLKKKPGQPKKKKSSEDDLKKLEVPKEYTEISAKEYPSWLQPRPKGYIERGVDDGEGTTSTLLWKPSEDDEQNNFSELDLYVEKCNPIAEKLNISANSPNFVDYILLTYINHDRDPDKALEVVSKLTKKILKEPVFNKEEVKRFENGVRKYGSELHPVQKLVKSQSNAMVVRFYYLWKKSKNGKLIWGNFEGRRHKKLQNVVKDEAKAETLADVPAIDKLADPEDDSSYEDEKIVQNNSMFTCKHCDTHKSVKWFRITGHDANSHEKSADGNDSDSILALCFRCARLWRRYAVEWESPDEVEKKTTKVTGWKKKVEAELMKDAEAIVEEASNKGGVVTYDLLPDGSPALQQVVVEPAPAPEPPKKPGRKPKHKKESESLTEPMAEIKKLAEVGPKTAKVKEAKVEKSKVEKPKVEKPKVKRAPAKPRAIKANGKAPKVVKDEVKAEIKTEAPVKVRAKPGPKKKEVKEGTTTPEVKPKDNGIAKEPPLKKQKKQPSLESLADQLRNDSYIDPNGILPANITSIIAGDKPQLLFPIDSRPCSVCFIKDSKLVDMLICSSCGVNVHGSCGGISIPDKMSRPITEWLCEVCVNEMKQLFSPEYSCQLCFAKFSNPILNKIGSNETRPNYLKPIYDSGKWCHLICAAFSANLIGFRPCVTNFPKKLTKDDYANKKIDLINKVIGIETVSNVFSNNFDKQCQICHKLNGSLIKCDECDFISHVTCAQDSENYSLGFKLDDHDESKLIKIDDKTGAIKPILLCSNHSLTLSIYSLQTLGKRVNQKEESKPLIQIYFEDISKNNLVKFNGPYLKSLQYLENMNVGKVSENDIHAPQTICTRCNTSSSPIWWDDPDETDKEICQRCYHFQDEEDSKESSPTEDFIDVLNKPLNGEYYGIVDEDDHVSSKILKPTNISDNQVQPMDIDSIPNGHSNGSVVQSNNIPLVLESRSKISIGDILS